MPLAWSPFDRKCCGIVIRKAEVNIPRFIGRVAYLGMRRSRVNFCANQTGRATQSGAIGFQDSFLNRPAQEQGTFRIQIQVMDVLSFFVCKNVVKQ